MLARRGKFNPQDLYSTRPDHLRRGLSALSESSDGSFKVLSSGKQIFPAEGGEGTPTDAALDSSLQQWGLGGGLSELLSLLCNQFQGEGAPLLAALLRAQCGSAGAIAASSARELREVLRQHQLDEVLSVDLLEAALARGFWNLCADSSGMHTREREAERLLERARRELWQEGSASRRELEAQIRIFLLRYQLGLAAAAPKLRVHLARPRGGLDQEALRQLGYTAAAGQPNLWVRLELDLLEMPLP